MATYAKGSISFKAVVDQINRKFTPRKNVCATRNGGPVKLIPASYMGAGTRTIGREGIGLVSKNYFFFRENPRSTGVGINEAAARDKFKQGVQWANDAFKDVSVVTANQLKMKQLAENPSAYIAVGDERMYIYGYSYPGFMRAFAIKAAKAGVLPKDHNLPDVVVPA